MRVGIACAVGLLLSIAGSGCGPGLEPPNESARSPRPQLDPGARPGKDEDDSLEGDAAAGEVDGLDAGAETDHTNDDAPAP